MTGRELVVLRNISGSVPVPGQESVNTVVLHPVARKGRWWGQYTDCLIIDGVLQALRGGPRNHFSGGGVSIKTGPLGASP